MGKPEAPADVAAAGAKVEFTKPGPHCMFTSCAAAEYVFDIADFRLLLAAANIAIVSCKHVLHVGALPPGRLTLSGK